MVFWWLVLGMSVSLVGCGDPPPTPAADTPPPTHRVEAATAEPDSPVPVTDTPTIVALLASPAASRTRAPTSTPSPPPTSTQTPTPPATSTATPTTTPSPTQIPSPTPQPSAQLQAASHQQINGDYDQAIAIYQALLDDDPTPDQAREARFGLAKAYLSNGDFTAAGAAWETFLAAYPDDERLPEATLMAARAYHGAYDCAKALPFYEAHLAADTTLADMVFEWQGDCFVDLATASAEPEPMRQQAIEAYRQALAATTNLSTRVGLREKIAAIHLVMEDYAAAVAEYDAILQVARIDAYRAKIEYLAGQALAAAGQRQAAHDRYRRAVDNYPKAEYSYFGLSELVDAGVAVDELQRGMVDYYAGASYPDAYDAAIRAFDRYLAAGTPEKAGQALYFKALAQRALEQPEAALETFNTLITDHPDSEQIPAAWIEKATTLAQLGKNDEAVKTYRDAAAYFPAHERAPKALLQAARIRESEGSYSQAATIYEELQAGFPGFEDADEALWRAGFAAYRAGDSDRAVAIWRTLLAKYPASAYRLKTLYWLGKLGALPVGQNKTGYWEQLVAADPHDYYGLRVRQIQAGDSLTSTRLITEAVAAPEWNPAEAEAEILAWLSSWTDVPTDTQLAVLPDSLARRKDVQRGEALLAAGLRKEALDAFDGARDAAWKKPLALTQLAFYFHDLGLHGLASRSAYRVVGLWPQGTIHEAPEALRRLAYPLAYNDLLSAEAQAYNLDPLLLAALVRQESLFEPVAESYAGARGLGQVMPATGEGIAQNLAVDDFVLDDLYRPVISIQFGAYYLSVQMGRFDEQILMALAAYNGGPGNTLRWQEAGGNDLDLFVEVITASQSRLYLQRVYEQYHTYEELYRPRDNERD